MSHMYTSFTLYNNSTCDICHLAKQRKLSYHRSNSVASSSFELFHFNIWDPLAIPSIQNHKDFLTILDDHKIFFVLLLLETNMKFHNMYKISST